MIVTVKTEVDIFRFFLKKYMYYKSYTPLLHYQYTQFRNYTSFFSLFFFSFLFFTEAKMYLLPHLISLASSVKCNVVQVSYTPNIFTSRCLSAHYKHWTVTKLLRRLSVYLHLLKKKIQYNYIANLLLARIWGTSINSSSPFNSRRKTKKKYQQKAL